jgi:hypothetical protein
VLGTVVGAGRDPVGTDEVDQRVLARPQGVGGG